MSRSSLSLTGTNQRDVTQSIPVFTRQSTGSEKRPRPPLRQNVRVSPTTVLSQGTVDILIPGVKERQSAESQRLPVDVRSSQTREVKEK